MILVMRIQAFAKGTLLQLLSGPVSLNGQDTGNAVVHADSSLLIFNTPEHSLPRTGLQRLANEIVLLCSMSVWLYLQACHSTILCNTSVQPEGGLEEKSYWIQLGEMQSGHAFRAALEAALLRANLSSETWPL